MLPSSRIPPPVPVPNGPKMAACVQSNGLLNSGRGGQAFAMQEHRVALSALPCVLKKHKAAPQRRPAAASHAASICESTYVAAALRRRDAVQSYAPRITLTCIRRYATLQGCMLQVYSKHTCGIVECTETPNC